MKFLNVSGIGLQEGSNSALTNINFSQRRFRKIAIAGETGSGKSSLLRIIAGFIQPTSGAVYFNGERIRGPQEVLVPGQPGIAYLSQEFELPQFLRVEQVLQYASTFSETEAQNLFELCRISHLLTRKTSELSGGERQRIALARLLLSSPQLLLLDEPFSNLDARHKSILKKVIHDAAKTLKITCILVSHDPLDTLSWADEILVFKAGKLVQQGTPEEIYRKPETEYVAGLFGSYNLIPPNRAAVFTKLLRLDFKRRSLLIRPEHLNFVTEAENSIPGKIKSTAFFGSYYETRVHLLGLAITVKTVSVPGKKGDAVFLSVAPESIWFI